jgi:DNA-directed RNA polymerase subunit RPC12/RpoP
MPAAVNESPCAQCGQPVPITLATAEPSDQLAAERTECPHCGARLLRAVDGHEDKGWRLDVRSGV